MNDQPSQPQSFFKAWMILLIMPLIGIVAMVIIIANPSDSSTQNTPQATQIILDPASPAPQTLPPRTPLPTSTSVINQSLPPIILSDMDGNPLDLSAFKGRQLIINFWASWCEPCKNEMPALQEYADAQDDNGPLVIAVTDPENGQTMEDIVTFIEEYELNLLIGIDQSAQLHYALGVPGLPTTFFINADGIIQGRRIGEVDLKAITDEVALLN